MTEDDVITFVIEYIQAILNETPGNLVTVIESNQNAPAPAKPYVLVHTPAVATDPLGRGNFQPADDTGKVEYSHDYESTITIEVIGGTHSFLQTALEAQYRDDVLQLFTDACIALQRTLPAKPATKITEDWIEKRAAQDWVLRWKNTGNYTPGYIKTVLTNGTYN